MPKGMLGTDGRPLQVDAATSARLGRIRQKGTAPEQTVRTILASCGIRYSLSNRDLPGSPDVANRKRRWAIFVHGCFWHAHSGCSRATVPKRNRDFWLAKFTANKNRDRAAVSRLKRQGYLVAVVWECDVEKRPEAVLQKLMRLIPSSRARKPRRIELGEPKNH